MSPQIVLIMLKVFSGRFLWYNLVVYYLNKIIGCAVSPIGITLVLMGLAFVLALIPRQKFRGGAKRLMVAAGVWLWAWSTPLASLCVGSSLEKGFLVDGQPPEVESFATADAIVLLGGSMGCDPDFPGYSEMWTSADRVRMAARLWKAGKAPKIIATGSGVEKSTKSILQDFGVPPEAVVFEDSPRNTEEEAKLIAKSAQKKVLLVTSAWHMKRAKLMFEKYAPNVEIVPAAADFENTLGVSGGIELTSFFPSPASLMWNSVTFHEWLGYFGYMWFK